MATLIWASGAEHGIATLTTDGAAFNTVTGAPGASATAAKNGAYGYLIDASAEVERFGITGLTGEVIVAGFWFQIATTAGGNTDIFRGNTAAGTPVALRTTSARNLRVLVGSVEQNESYTFAEDTWYWIDLMLECVGTTREITYRVLDTSFAEVASGNVSDTGETDTNFNQFLVGIGATATAVYYYDDIVVSVTGADYPLGPHEILKAAPSGAADHQSITTTEYQYTDDFSSFTNFASGTTESDSASRLATLVTTDGIRMNVAGAPAGNARWNLNDPSFTAGSTVQAAQAWIAVREASTGTNNAVFRVRESGGTTSDVFASANPGWGTTWNYLRLMLNTSPAGSAWTDALVNGMTFECDSTDAAPAIWLGGAVLEVAYKLATVATVTGAAALTGTGSLAADHELDVLAAGALTGAGSQTVASLHIALAAAALTGTATQTIAGTRIVLGAAVLTGAGTQTIVGVRIRDGVAALTGLGSLTADGNVPAVAHSLVLVRGWEQGVHSTTGGGAAAPGPGTVSQSIHDYAARTGGYGLVANANGLNAQSRFVSLLGSRTADDVVISFWYQPHTLVGQTGTDRVVQFFLIERSTTDNVVLSYTGDAQIRLSLEEGGSVVASQDTSSFLVADEWVHIDLWANRTSGDITVEWRVNGIDQTPVSFTMANTTNQFTRYTAGVYNYVNVNCENYYDDVGISETDTDYPIGPLEVLAVSPSGAADHQGLSIGGQCSYSDNLGTWTNFASLTESDSASRIAHPFNLTSGVRLSGSTITGNPRWLFANPSDNGNHPVGIYAMVAVREASSGANNATLRIRQSAGTPATEDIFSGDPPWSTFVAYLGLALPTNLDANPWSNGDEDTLQIEIDSTDASPAWYLLGAMVEIAYPTIIPVFGHAALTGTGSVTAAGLQIAYGEVDLVGTGSLVLDVTPVVFGAAALTGAGSLTASIIEITEGEAALTGTGALVADGAVVGDEIEGGALLTGTGSMTVAGEFARVGAAALTGTGTLEVTDTAVVTLASAALTGVGALSLVGEVSFPTATVLTGFGSLTATGIVVPLDKLGWRRLHTVLFDGNGLSPDALTAGRLSPLLQLPSIYGQAVFGVAVYGEGMAAGMNLRPLQPNRNIYPSEELFPADDLFPSNV